MVTKSKRCNRCKAQNYTYLHLLVTNFAEQMVRRPQKGCEKQKNKICFVAFACEGLRKLTIRVVPEGAKMWAKCGVFLQFS